MTFILTVLWPLLRRHWQAVAIAALALVLMAACHQRDEGLKREGAMRAELAALSAKTIHDSAVAYRYDTIAIRDTQRLRKVLTTYDTVRSTLKLTDTVAVKVTLAAADTVIRQCRVTVEHLLSSCAAKDTVIGDLRQQLALRAMPAAANSVSLKQKVAWALIGAGLNEAVHRFRP